MAEFDCRLTCSCMRLSITSASKLRKCRLAGCSTVSAHKQTSGAGRCRLAVCSAAGLAAHRPAEAAAPTSAYVHLPFCKRRCYYCDFPVSVVGVQHEAPGVQRGMQEYVDLLATEIQATPRLSSAPLDTLFFGGGTPSLLPPPLLEQLLDQLERRHGIAAAAEVSMEADPGTFDASRLRQYMALGVTRFSIGVQAFQPELLAACGRSHSVAEVHAAVEALHEAGATNWSLDLISGLPHLTMEAWRRSLELAIEAQPAHVSVYDLQVEARTPFARWYQPGAAPLPSDNASADMYAAASSMLRGAGFEHYELSNYAKPGMRCRHNMMYWSNVPFYAYGLGAASFLEGRRFARPRRMKEYAAWVQQLSAGATGGGAALAEQAMPAAGRVGGADGAGAAGDRQPERSAGHVLASAEAHEPQSQLEDLLDTVMLSLRLADGLDLAKLEAQHGAAAAHVVQGSLLAAAQRGLVEEVSSNNRPGRPVLRLTDPAGLLLCNDVTSDVFLACDDLQLPAQAAAQGQVT